MAIDIRVYPELSPRIIEILEPTTSASVQEIVDAVRAWEDSWVGIAFPKLIDAAGKENLGGGVTVGITATLQNAQIAFQQRGGSDATGTITTGSTDGTTLEDTSATFITDSIISGDSIYNITDGSMTTVLEVISETELRTFALQGGSDNQWDISDSYRVWNKISCDITGGNLVAIDDVGAELKSGLPTAEVYLTKESSSSATISSSTGVTDKVYVDTDALSNGDGSAGSPFDNIGDGVDYAEANNLKIIVIQAEITLDRNLKNFEIKGIGNPVINCAGFDLKNTHFERCTIKGTYVNAIIASNCVISGTSYLEGVFDNCIFPVGTSTISSGKIVDIVHSSSGEPGETTPTIDMNTTGILSIRGYNGGIKLTNYTGSSAHSIDMSSGQVILDSTTVTSGTFVVRGIGKLVDEAGTDIDIGTTTWNGGVTVINELVSPMVQEAIDQARLAAQLSA
jgi:hypothetical protein